MDFRDWLKNNSTIVYHVSPNSGLYKVRPTGRHRGHQSVPQQQAGVYVTPKFSDAVTWFVSYIAWKKDHTQSRKHDRNHNPTLHYQNATIYKIRLPKDLLKSSWYNNSWEPEYFIPEDQLDQLQIVSKKTYSFQELSDLRRRQQFIRYHLEPGPEKAATQAKKNPAAQAYLRLREKFNQAALKSPLDPNVRDEASKLFRELEKYFFQPRNGFWDIQKPDDQIPQIIARLEKLLHITQ